MDKRKLPQTEEHKLKIKLAQLGIKRPQTSGIKNGFWKGDTAKYSALHMWVKHWKGKPSYCEMCGRTDLRPQQYQWANIDHTYKRILDDYIRLCASCHQKYDVENNQYQNRGGKRKK